MNDLITIVVPVYRVPIPLLKRCLNSICVQTDKNFEAILIDDGSPDDCGKICDEYARQYDYMRVIHQKNGGLSVVRNLSLIHICGVVGITRVSVANLPTRGIDVPEYELFGLPYLIRNEAHASNFFALSLIHI